MNFLRKFESPQEFKDDNFLSGIMTENVKPCLESFKVRKIQNLRQRANTLNMKPKQRCNIYY